MKEIRHLKEKGKPDGTKPTDGLVAAMRIQKVWRGFTERRKTRRGKLEEMYLIGMVPHPIKRDAAAIEDAKQVQLFQIDVVEMVMLIWFIAANTAQISIAGEIQRRLRTNTETGQRGHHQEAQSSVERRNCRRNTCLVQGVSISNGKVSRISIRR